VAEGTHGFSCDVCGNALGIRRVRQGLRRHPGCGRALPPADVAAALVAAHNALTRLGARSTDAELTELFARATAQARDLIDDLNRWQCHRV